MGVWGFFHNTFSCLNVMGNVPLDQIMISWSPYIFRTWHNRASAMQCAEIMISFITETQMQNTSGLTHWGRVTHICVSDLTSIGSDNSLSPGRRQAIIRTNAGLLLIRPLGTNFSEFLVEILIFSFKKMCLKVSSAKRRPFCLGLNELIDGPWLDHCDGLWKWVRCKQKCIYCKSIGNTF